MENENTQSKYFKIEEKLEAIIFLSKEILKIDSLASFYDIEKQEMKKLLLNLKEKRKDTGINLKIENDVVYLVSNPLFGLDIKNFFNPEVKLKKLSKSAMETLAIIAYKGPVTKLEIEQIRGVGAEKSLTTLLEKKLIYISGKKKAMGTPNLYEVSEEFYSYLNIYGKKELPGYKQFEQIKLLYSDEEKNNETNNEIKKEESSEKTEKLNEIVEK
ncbi:SMC-Scp complex subunit ScpB [Leptotrichia sp. oral taxon 847]|uniref:SMC-Scp complex subunit ScpB n=1 Tax=Leptotrichia sp. oral taxon 847 TaxID=1785996 RepID=UPI000ACFBD55|nr:SMC-Scp complex subunit ScpB [Leptotrichia sp. oral taxon 847]